MVDMSKLVKRSAEVRMARTKLKVALRADEITLGDALRAPECATLTVVEVMRWQVQWGQVRIGKAMRMVGVSESRVCGELTDRQVRALDGYVKVPSGYYATEDRRRIVEEA